MAKGKGGISRKAEGVARPSYFKETEKAVSLKLTVEDLDLEQSRTRTVWVPKSQLAEDGRPSLWITGQKVQEFYSYGRTPSSISTTWEDAMGKKFSASMTKSEIDRAASKIKAFQNGTASYNALIAQAKALGIKGIRFGMKRSTIEEKIRKYKSGER